jgi:hypothetical protein
MGLGFLLALISLRSGMGMRRARQQKRSGRAALRRSHLRLVKITVPWIVVGFAAGPLARWWVQGETPFQTAHAWIGLTAVVLWSTTATVGHMLEIGAKRFTSDRARDIHAVLSFTAVLLSAVAGIFGYSLLP